MRGPRINGSRLAVPTIASGRRMHSLHPTQVKEVRGPSGLRGHQRSVAQFLGLKFFDAPRRTNMSDYRRKDASVTWMKKNLGYPKGALQTPSFKFEQ